MGRNVPVRNLIKAAAPTGREAFTTRHFHFWLLFFFFFFQANSLFFLALAVLYSSSTAACAHTVGVTHGKHSLWVSLRPHVGVVDLLQDHPALVVFAVL